MEKIEIAGLQYLYDNPDKAFCRPCLNALTKGNSRELEIRWLADQKKEFEECEATCSKCGQVKTVVRAKMLNRILPS